MKKNYIRMNNNKKYLSLGNIISIIKKNSSSVVNQTDIFCSIFDINDINNTTVNNYCIGIRAIGIEYRNSFLDKYNNDKNGYISNILLILNILDNKIYKIKEDSLNIINNSKKLRIVIEELLTIGKNDESISDDIIDKWKELDNYDCFVEMLYQAIVINKQPLYTHDINIKTNKKELDEYLKAKLYYGQSYISTLMYLANKNNMYACADLGSLWFDGFVSGYVDYNKSFEYYKKAALKGHPKSCWMVANLMISKKVKYDEKEMWEYLNKSIELGSAAGYNTLGLCYKNGIKEYDVEKAKECFKISSDMGYAYAFNNLGKICEENNDIEEAIKYYKISADMNESWALNKVGEYYRNKGDYKKAFMYYNQSISCPVSEIYSYAYYNLSEYFYKNGCKEANIKKDIDKSNLYMNLFNKYRKNPS